MNVSKKITPLTKLSSQLMKINGLEYEMCRNKFPVRNFKKGKQIRLLIKNVEQVIPEFVEIISDGIKGVDYRKLVS